MLDSVVLQGDDTGLKVLDEKAPGGAKRGHLWFYVGDGTHCAVVYTPDWTKNGPGLFLAARRGGYLVADAYTGGITSIRAPSIHRSKSAAGRTHVARSSRSPSVATRAPR